MPRNHKDTAGHAEKGVRLDRTASLEVGDCLRNNHDGKWLAPNSHVYIGWVCVFSVVLAQLYFNNLGSFFAAVTVLASLVVLGSPNLQMQAVDWTVLLIMVSEIPSVLCSQYRSNSVRGTLTIATFAMVYYAVRLTIRSRLQVLYLCSFLGLGGAWLAISAIRPFGRNVSRFGEVGLTDLVAFRSRLISTPHSWVLGDWFTLLLLALPFACAPLAYACQRNRRWLGGIVAAAPLLIGAILSISLSRAVFWSTVLFCLAVSAFMIWGRILTVGRGMILLGAALGALFLMVAVESVLFPGISKTYTGQHTSQVRSSEGRLAIWQRSARLVHDHPLWGVGSSNSALALTSSADQGETASFASRTFSLPFQVLVEKGIVGLLLYALFVALVAREFVHTMGQPSLIRDPDATNDSAKRDTANEIEGDSAYKAMVCCLGAGLAAVFFRELTYSSLMEQGLTIALVATLAALICRSRGSALSNI